MIPYVLRASGLLFSLALLANCASPQMSNQLAGNQPLMPDRMVTMNDDLSDAVILDIFITGNQGEVITSQPVDESAGEQVYAFAQRMITEHSAVVRQAQELGQRTGLTPQANVASMAMDNSARGIADRLRPLDGEALAQEYIMAQIVLHQHMLDLLDFTLIPNAQNAELRTLLQQTRPAIAQHLAHALEIHEMRQRDS